MKMLPELVLLSSLVVASCLGCRHIPPDPLSPDVMAATLENRSLADPKLGEFLAQRSGNEAQAWPKTKWNLDELMFAALFFQPDLRTALAAAQMVTAGIETARQRPNPTFSAQPQFVTNPASGISPWISTFQLNWMFETGGKRAKRIALAEARARAAELVIPTAIWSIRGRLNTAVVMLQAAKTRRALLAEALEAQVELVQRLDERVRAGALAETSVMPQRMASTQLRADLATSSRQIRESHSMLAASLGVPLDAIRDVEIDFPLEARPEDLAELTSESARRAALLGRWDIRALLAEYDAAEADLKLQISQQYPDVKFGPSYEYDQQSNKWGLQLQVNLPLMNQNQGPIEEALAKRSWVAARFEALQAQVIADVNSAREALEGAATEMIEARTVVDAARERLNLAEQALEMGAVDRGVVLASAVEVQRAHLLLTNVQERSLDAVVRLEQAIQPDRDFVDASIVQTAPDTQLGALP